MVNNCLTYCLDQWLYLKEYKLWYNSDHVIIIEPEIDLKDKGYLPVEDYGVDYFKGAFKHIPRKYKTLLRKYFNR